MDGCAAGHHAHKFVLGETGDTDPTGRGIPQGSRNFFQGVGTSNTNLWFGDMGPFGINREEGIRDSHRVSQTYHREANVAVRIQDVGDAQGRRIAGISGNAVGDDLYR